MKRMVTKDQVKGLCKITETSDGNIVVNSAIECDDNGDCTIGRDLYVEDELVISHLSKLVDDDGAPFINTSGLTTGSYNIKLVIDATGKATIEVDQ